MTPKSSANLAFENSKDVLTWRAPKANGANVGENLKPNRANKTRTSEANSGANEAQNGTNSGTNLDANEANLSAPNASNADTTKVPKAKLTKEQIQLRKFLKQILKAPKGAKEAFSISRGEKQTWKDAINEKLKELKEKEQISSTNKEQPSANLGENGTNSGTNEANLHSTHGANLDEANSGANDARANQGTDEANLRAQQEANFNSANLGTNQGRFKSKQ